MNDYMQYLGSILAVAGASLQWLRQFRSFSDWWIGLITFVLAAAGYALCHTFAADVRGEIIQALIWIPGGMAAVGGGTFAASKASASVAMIPVTDSK